MQIQNNKLIHADNSDLVNGKLTIPNSVTHIGAGAFRGNQLTSVEIPNSATHIGDWAFRGNQLTSVEIPNSVTHIGAGAFDGNTDIIQGNRKISIIDGVATIIRSKKQRGGFEFFEGSFFNSNQKCFVAKKGKIYAHGETLREAIEDVNFKFLQENHNVDDIVYEIKSTKKITKSQFRILTGACNMGCNEFMKSNNITDAELPLEKALKLLKGQFGWSKMEEYFL